MDSKPNFGSDEKKNLFQPSTLQKETNGRVKARDSPGWLRVQCCVCVPLLRMELTPPWSEPGSTVWSWKGARKMYSMKSREKQLRGEELPYLLLEGLEQTIDTLLPDLYWRCG